ncbi:Flp pilus assembly protein CpaB [Actibacterium pelagium]|uniref:Flp pilus assembly protein CpaB n=2 Tax=Actibacterium pelagium TaxID=2029103 RepID=A0A917ALN4_9RHOB|nr:Flp pilus assembly protein CpaB [Actibacterium pelagium]GGE60111.1 Flp pilus assembly protein CpaB [Actibacterium pelagium]
MRLVFGLVLLIGVGLAGFAVYMAQGYIGQYQSALASERAERQKQLEQQIPLADVYITKRPLRYGEQIKKQDVELIRWPLQYLPEGSFNTIESLFPEGEDEFRTALRAMEKHEPLLRAKISNPGDDAGITSRLKKGNRAFAINVDVSSGVSGFLRPGDRVDVYWTGTIGGERGTKLIQANVPLIAVDQIADLDRNNPLIARTVTVEATPQEVAALAQAQATGRLTLALVGASDDTVSTDIEISQNELLGIQAPVVVPVEQKKVCTVSQRRGTETVIVQVKCPDEE